MSWLTDYVINPISSVFSGSQNIGPVSNPSQYEEMLGLGKNKSIWSSPDLWSGIIGAGTSLAGNYFNQQNAASMNDTAIAQAENQIEAEKQMTADKIAAELKAAGIGAGAQVASAKIAAGAALGVAKKNNLQQLYSQWASNTRQAGADEADAATKTGAMMQAPILARLAALR